MPISYLINNKKKKPKTVTVSAPKSSNLSDFISQPQADNHGGFNSTANSSFNKIEKTAVQKAEEERAARMRQGLSSFVRSQVDRSTRKMSAPTYVQKNTFANLRNTLAPVNKTAPSRTTGFKYQVRRSLQPAKELADYTRAQQWKYGSDYSRRPTISLEEGQKLRAGMPTTSNVLESWRPTATAREQEFRKKYGFDKAFRQKQIEDRLKGSAINDPESARYTKKWAEEVVSAPEGTDTKFDRVRWADVKAGHSDAWARKYAEDTLKRQFGTDLDDETLAELQAQRAKSGYMAGQMAGQMEQYGLTRGALSGVGLVGKAAQAERAAKAAGNLSKAKKISFATELGIDQAASLPLNIIDAIKENDASDMLKRFGLNQLLDVVLSAGMTRLSIANNPAFKEAEALHNTAKVLREQGDNATAEVADIAAKNKLKEVPTKAEREVKLKEFVDENGNSRIEDVSGLTKEEKINRKVEAYKAKKQSQEAKLQEEKAYEASKRDEHYTPMKGSHTREGWNEIDRGYSEKSINSLKQEKNSLKEKLKNGEMSADDVEERTKLIDSIIAEKQRVAKESKQANSGAKTPKQQQEPKAKAEEPKAKVKEEPKAADTRAWQEQAKDAYKTSEQRAKAVKNGKVPSLENGEVVNAIDRLRNTKEFANIKDVLDRGVKDGLYNRRVRHLKNEIENAVREIEADPEKVINEILEYHPNGAKANDVPADAIPWVMKGYALCKWADQNGMTALKEDIAATMAKAQSAGGSVLRAGQVFTVMADSKTQRDLVLDAAKKLTEKFGNRLDGHKVEVPEELLDELEKAQTDARKEEILNQITIEMWNQIPMSFMEAFDTFRVTAMLANTTTMARNIASNAAFGTVRKINQATATAMETGAEKLKYVNKEDRLHSFYNPFSEESKKNKAFWYRDYQKNRIQIKGQGRYNDAEAGLFATSRPQEARHFGVKAGGGKKGGVIGKIDTGLEGTRKVTTAIMEGGDEIFIAPAYADAATQIMHARGWKISDLTPSRIDEIRELATREAQEATYRDPSDLAKTLAKWGRWEKGDGGWRFLRSVVVNALQPFKKTPINIGKRAFEYSPAGLAKGINDVRVAAATKDSKAMARAVNELSKGTTGTGLVAVGFLLAKEGLINAELPTDEEGYLLRDLGYQNYALNLHGKTRTLEWAAPGAIPILTGAALYSEIQKRGIEGVPRASIPMDVLTEALLQSANPIMEMSFMQSYQDLIDAADGQEGMKKWEAMILQLGATYASQLVPTAMGKLARILDPVRRDTSTTADTLLDRTTQKTVNKIINKIPNVGAPFGKEWGSASLPAYVDSFGNEQRTDSLKDRIVQNTISPWYTKEINDDPVYQEVIDVNKHVDDNIIPSSAIGKGKHELTLNGEKIDLDTHDIEYYKRIRGKGNEEQLNELFDSDEYKNMSYEEKGEAIKEVEDEAKAKAKEETLIKKGKDEWDVRTDGFSGKKAEYQDAKEAGISLDTYIKIVKAEGADTDGSGKLNKDEATAFIDKQNMNNKQKSIMFSKLSTAKNPFGTGEAEDAEETGDKLKAASGETVELPDDVKKAGVTEEQYASVVSQKDKIDTNGSGRVSQAELQAYLDKMDLTTAQKSAIWKNYNKRWKKNPYDSSSSGSSKSSKKSRSGRRSSGSSKKSSAKKATKTASEKKFASLQTGKAPKSSTTTREKTASEKRFEEIQKNYSANSKTPITMNNINVKGLTKAQKKALLKLAMKKLEV